MYWFFIGSINKLVNEFILVSELIIFMHHLHRNIDWIKCKHNLFFESKSHVHKNITIFILNKMEWMMTCCIIFVSSKCLTWTMIYAFGGTNGCIFVIVFFHALENGSYHVFLFLYQIVKLKIEINIGYQNSMHIKNIIKGKCLIHTFFG
jgi:hypothetical protein